MHLSELIGRAQPGKPIKDEARRAYALEERILTKLELRVAHLKAAEATTDVIAVMCDMSIKSVSDILDRPRVQKYLRLLGATIAEEMEPVVQSVKQSIESKAKRAFEVECDVMEDLRSVGPGDRAYVRAQLGSAMIAQDLLDRSGNRAPTKIIQKNEFNVSEEAAERLTRIVSDVVSRRAIDVTPDRTNGNSNGSTGNSEDSDRR